MRLKQVLIEQNAWSQYLEVGIGPDAEVFTKAPVLSSVGTGMDAGLHPEIDLEQSRAGGRAGGARAAAASSARRSATMSICATSRAARRCCCPRRRTTTPPAPSGPLLRLFDDGFSLDDVREDGCRIDRDGAGRLRASRAHSSIGRISRDPDRPRGADDRARVHQYPDGFALFLGTMFAPVQDRDAPGKGFTHKTRRHRYDRGAAARQAGQPHADER